jgi:hypothetical protein
MHRIGASSVVAAAVATLAASCIQASGHPLADIRKGNVRRTAPGAITGLSLVNAATDTKVTDLENGTIIDMSVFPDMISPAFNINASFSGSGVGSVVFGHNQISNVHSENVSWFSFCGNAGNDFWNCSSLTVGNHTVTATPYSRRYMRGDAGEPYTVSFSIVSGSGLSMPTALISPAPSPKLLFGVFPPVPLSSDDDDVDDFGNETPFAPLLIGLNALPSLKVNVTSDRATVILLVTAQAEEWGIAEFSVQASGPEYTYQTSGSCKKPKSMVDGSLACNVSLVFEQYIPAGNYTLEVTIFSEEYDYYFVSNEELESRMLPRIIEVANGIVDKDPPTLLDLDIAYTIVNITNDDTVFVDLSLVIQDELSGFLYGYVEAIDDQGSSSTQSYFSALDFPYNNTKPGEPFKFYARLNFGSYNRPGNYTLQVVLGDKNNNVAILSSVDLANKTFPSVIEVDNPEYDGTPPVLLNVSLLSKSVNVTLGSGTVDLEVVVQDDKAGISYAQMSLNQLDPQTGWISYQLSVEKNLEKPIAGTAIPVKLRLKVPMYTLAGKYLIYLSVTDGKGNTLAYDSSELANLSFPYFVNVINDLEDRTPPKLLDLVPLTPLTVNASSDSKIATFQVTVQDDIAGVSNLYLSASNEQGGYLYDPDYKGGQQAVIGGKPAMFNVSLAVPQSTKPGTYSLELNLNDEAGNYESYSASQLAEMGLPSSIVVVNPAYDATPPVLTDLVILSSAKVDVSQAPATVELQLVVQDAVSGFKYGVVELWSTDQGMNGATVSFGVSNETGQVTMTSSVVGPSENFVYNVSYAVFMADQKKPNVSVPYTLSLPIPRYIAAGLYEFQVQLVDFADNMAYMSSSMLRAQWLPSQIQVTNTIVDAEPPMLVNLTASTPTVDVTAGSPATIEWQMVALDDVSGLQYAYLSVSGPDYYNTTKVDVVTNAADGPAPKEPVVLNFSCTLEPYHRSGTYTIEVGLQDVMVHYRTLYSGDLIAMGLPGSFFVNSDY